MAPLRRPRPRQGVGTATGSLTEQAGRGRPSLCYTPSRGTPDAYFAPVGLDNDHRGTAGCWLRVNHEPCPAHDAAPVRPAGLYVAAAVVLALALVQLVTLGMAWFAVVVLVALMALAGTVGLIAAVVLVAALIAWRRIRRRGSGSGAPANGS